LELANPLNSRQKCVLDRVVGVLLIAEDAPGHVQQPATVSANARFKGGTVTSLHPRQQGRFVRVHTGLAELSCIRHGVYVTRVSDGDKSPYIEGATSHGFGGRNLNRRISRTPPTQLQSLVFKRGRRFITSLFSLIESRHEL